MLFARALIAGSLRSSVAGAPYDAHLQHLGCERDDLHETLVAQLAADGAEDAGTARLTVCLDEHGRVLVEADVAAVRPPPLLDRADDDRLDDVALLDAGTGQRVLDGRDDDVADPGVTT